MTIPLTVAVEVGQAAGIIPKKPRRRPRPKPLPKLEQQIYFVEILKVLEKAEEVVNEVLTRSRLRNIANQAESVEGIARQDNLDLDLDDIMRLIESSFWTTEQQTLIEQLADQMLVKVETKQRKEINRQLRSLIGFDAVSGIEGLEQALRMATRENVGLIKAIPERYFSRIEQGIQRSIRRGIRAESFVGEVEKIIKEAGAKTKSNAALIARDQTNKWYGELQRKRQADLGATHYIWRTTQDERVRPSHAEKEGKRFAWDNPPPDTGHPGQDYACRCTAEADLSTVPGLGPEFGPDPDTVGKKYNQKFRARLKRKQEEAKKKGIKRQRGFLREPSAARRRAAERRRKRQQQ